ncbi:hypothetical protein F4813DRAFT_29814 [Daldinia decipiens]|uniref:uncharacterized protein n=1 Tax=Daldinia decipiens TaxID=326647 RepID=UPI0020C2AE03|nr:uncharacterized protein F4813DRAFT_29814 [Daldinia decipiens]KAI1659363.1 hypothetical protein F4813DRAFT_29814 [Daldinia decipiens]
MQDRLQRNIEETNAASLVDFSLSDYTFISRQYAASESLAQSLADKVTPILAGGAGYWPEDDLDFSRINELNGEKKRELLDKWQTEVSLAQLSLLDLDDD